MREGEVGGGLTRGKMRGGWRGKMREGVEGI